MIQIVRGSVGVFGTAVAVLVFLLLYKVDVKSCPAKSALARISMLSLDMYLCCYIFDRLIYPHFLDRYYVTQSQFGKYFFVIVPLVFLASLLTAQVKDWVFRLFTPRSK